MVVGVTLTLITATGSVSGTIENENGDRVSGAYVQILGTSSAVYTDSNGDFQIGNISVGTHQLRVTRAGYDDKTIDITVVKDANNHLGFIIIEDVSGS